MNVLLINNPTLSFIDSGIGECYDKGSYGVDTEKGINRIDRICNQNQHDSMLRFTHYIFQVELSTSALLEWTRHQVGVDYAVKSTRYCTKQDVGNIKVEFSKNEIVNDMLLKHIEEIKQLIIDNPTIGNDDLKLLLPQGFIYRMQVQFNAQSLKHFLKLRTSKKAHYHIRDLAFEVFNKIPNEHKFIFKDIVSVEI